MSIDCPGHADFGKSSYGLFTDKNGEFRRMVAELNSVKPFNQFASEMADLSKRLSKLDAKIHDASISHMKKLRKSQPLVR